MWRFFSKLMRYHSEEIFMTLTLTLTRIVFVLSLAAVFPTWAQEAIGYVKTVSGDATVVDNGKPIKAQVGTPIKMGNSLKTGPKGSMGVTFKDNTVISFG